MAHLHPSLFREEELELEAQLPFGGKPGRLCHVGERLDLGVDGWPLSLMTGTMVRLITFQAAVSFWRRRGSALRSASLFPGPDSISGSAWRLGDVVHATLYLSPAKPGQVISGAGPAFTFPTATDSKLRSRMTASGPPSWR